MKVPQISVIIPCYKQAEFLDECLNSVIKQTFKEWECIIVNDGSPDNTEEIALSWCKNDNRIRYVKKENGGLSSARNCGIENAMGKYILPLDADDKIGHRYMELALPYFMENTNVKVVYCLAEYFGSKSGQWKLPPYTWESLLHQNMIFASALFKRKDWESIKGYDTNMRNGYEDWEFWINLIKNSGQVVLINSVQFFYRQKQKSMITILNERPEWRNQIGDYVYRKHQSLYSDSFGSYLQLLHGYENITKKLKMTKDYKIGNAILYIPRTIKKLLKMGFI